MRKLLWSVLFFFISLGIILFVYYFKVPPFYSFSLRVMDMFYAFNHSKPSDKVVLILIDEKSVNRFGRWPWSRCIIAHGLEKLKGAKVIALDMVFSESTVPSSDAKLSDTINGLGNVVCGFFMRGSATENPSDEVIDVLSDSAFLRVPEKLKVPMYQYIEANIEPVIESCFLSGTLNVESDEDGIIRHYPLLSIFEGNVYPSLGLQALRDSVQKML